MKLKLLESIRFVLINAIFAYAGFGIYSILIAPHITAVIVYNEVNYWVGIFGLIILILEYYAAKFKLWMIRVRAEQYLLEMKKSLDDVLILNPAKWLMYALFFRVILRLMIYFLSLTALGVFESRYYEYGQMSMILMFGIEMYLFLIIYIKSNIYQDQVRPADLNTALYERDEWRRENVFGANTKRNFYLEFFSDIILNIYSYMVFTVVWYLSNGFAIGQLKKLHAASSGMINAALAMLLMLAFMIIFFLIPIRIAYWLNDSMFAVSRKQKRAFAFFFIISSVYTFVPTISTFVCLYMKVDESIREFLFTDRFSHYLVIALLLLIAIVQILVQNINSKKLNEFVILQDPEE